MSNSELNRRTYRVVLRLADQSVLAKIENARHYANRMAGNTYFTSPNPPLAKVISDAQELEKAWDLSRDGSRTAIRTMYNLEKQLDHTLTILGHYVQDIANGEKSPDVVITSSGMEYQLSPGALPRVFTVKAGQGTGTAVATAEARNGVKSYIWEYREKGAPQWTQAAITVTAAYTFTGLNRLTDYEFRHKTISLRGESDWSPAVVMALV